jgi:hypothetical protein
MWKSALRVFSLQAQRLNTYNFMIVLWSLVSLGGCLYVLAISHDQLIHAYAIMGFNIFQVRN